MGRAMVRAMGVQWACNGRAMYTRCYIMMKTIDQSFGWPEPLVCQSASLAWCFAANNTLVLPTPNARARPHRSPQRPIDRRRARPPAQRRSRPNRAEPIDIPTDHPIDRRSGRPIAAAADRAEPSLSISRPTTRSIAAAADRTEPSRSTYPPTDRNVEHRHVYKS